MTVLTTNDREFERACQRVGDMLRSTGVTRLANPYRIWKLDPPQAPGPSSQLDRERA